MLLAEGTKIRDTYEVERFLGEGAFAEVYRVNHRFLGRQAMKSLPSQHAGVCSTPLRKPSRSTRRGELTLLIGS